MHVLKPYTKFGPCRPCVYCVAIRIARLAFVGVVFRVELQNGLREFTAFAEDQQLAIGDLAHLSMKLAHVQGLVGSIRGIPEIPPEVGCLWRCRCMLQYVQPFTFSAQLM